MPRKLFSALEDIADPSLRTEESEIVIYSKILNPEGLKQADRVEHHRQFENRFASGERCRVRSTTIAVTTEFCFTFKVKRDAHFGIEAFQEYNTPVDLAFFDAFSEIACREVNKTRYVFDTHNVELSVMVDDNKQVITIPDLEYEVDVYRKPDGTESEWCKIDVEVDPVLDFITEHFPDVKDIKLFVKVSHLPFQPSDPIIASIASDEQKAFISQLWETEFSRCVAKSNEGPAQVQEVTVG